MNEQMAQQANVYIPPSKEQRWFDTFGTLIPTDTMYPLAWVRETSVIPDERATQFRQQLYLPMTIATVASIASLVVGCSLMLTGTVLIAVDRWPGRVRIGRARSGYSAIGDQTRQVT